MSNLSLRVDAEEVRLPPSAAVVIGRDPGAEIVVAGDLVSRRHLAIARVDGNWTASDLGTLNGTFLDGRRLAAHESVVLRPGLSLMLGDPERGARVRVLVVESDPAVVVGSSVTLGRSPDNTIVIDDPMVSGRHARLLAVPDGRLELEDLGSTNGTFVDGARVDRCALTVGSVVSVGRVLFDVTPTGLVRLDERPGGPGAIPALTVSGVSFSVPTSKAERSAGRGAAKALLDDVTFIVPPRSLVAVIGPSGAGKSTLLRAMIGGLRPDRGQVLFHGFDMAAHGEALRQRVGVVPQDDLVHADLTARQALDYAALLRFSDDSTGAERAAAVDWALQELDLTSHADTRIRQLSGGQRKRVSTAMELLTRPDLLLLDEPTSGLDPNLDREVMGLLRELAHGTRQSPDGRTVLVITHSTENLNQADLVLLLAPGGKVAYFGAPGRLPAFFSDRLGADASFAAIYSLIARDPDAARDAARVAFAASGRAPTPVAQVAGDPPGHGAGPARRRRLGRQSFTLLRRQARLMLADRSLLVFTVALPIVVALLTLTVRSERGFNAAETTDAVADPRILLVVLIFGAVLMGMVPSVRQLVAERPIFRREAGVGIRPSAYLAAKLVLLGVVCAVQSALMVGVALALLPHPAVGVAWPMPVESFIVIWATAWTCAALGLLLSAVAATSEQVMPVMVVVLMFQLVMCGGVLSVTAPLINEASMLSPSRWGFAAAASSLDLNRAVACNAQILAKAKEDEEVNRKAKEATDEANDKAAADAVKHGLPAPAPEQPKVRHTTVDCATVDDLDPLWARTGAQWLVSLAALGLWFAVYSVAAHQALRRTVRP